MLCAPSNFAIVRLTFSFRLHPLPDRLNRAMAALSSTGLFLPVCFYLRVFFEEFDDQGGGGFGKLMGAWVD